MSNDFQIHHMGSEDPFVFDLEYCEGDLSIKFDGQIPSPTQSGFLKFPSQESWPGYVPSWAVEKREVIKERLIEYSQHAYKLEEWLPAWLESNSWTPPPPRKFSEQELLEQRAAARWRMIRDLNRRMASSPRTRLNQLEAPKERRKLNWFQNLCGYVSLLIMAAVFIFQIYSCTSSTH